MKVLPDERPGQAEKVLTAMVKAVKKPVTVKFRKGFNDQSINAVEFAKMAESCGVAAVAVHGLPGNSIIPERQIGISSAR